MQTPADGNGESLSDESRGIAPKQLAIPKKAAKETKIYF